MPQLGVNIDHVATLRQARGTPYPDPLAAALTCQQAGAHGITVHLREDRRHIQDSDVTALRQNLTIPLNLEMANAPDILATALRIRPHEACIVPERRQELTTEGGLDAAATLPHLTPTVAALTQAGTTVSLFIDPEPRQIHAAARAGAPCIELHTGTYADGDPAAQAAELQRLHAAALLAHSLGLRVNAGHGLTLQNLPPILALPHLHTLNIGHSIISHALFTGLHQATLDYLHLIANPPAPNF